MSDPIQRWLIDNHFGAVVRREDVAGGCIGDCWRLHTERGGPLFLKQLLTAPADMFLAEAEGLKALASTGALRIPAVLHWEQEFILLEDLGHSRPQGNYWINLGRGLAALHRESRPRFGFSLDNYCGATPQHNRTDDDGFRFFAEQRLLALGAQALAKNLLERTDYSSLEWIAARLANWIPRMPAVLIHGDLWSGNTHCDEKGQPALIDPACYWGWAEAELAMTSLFGGFGDDFYASYAEASDMDSNWRERAPLYNLYHLLNHLLLFGSSYRASVQSTLNRYAG